MNISLGINLDQEYADNLEGLINQISLKKCCAFIGAGLSHEAGYNHGMK